MSDHFYENMTDHYHLIFEDWDASMRRQGEMISKLLPPPKTAGFVLDVGHARFAADASDFLFD